jgi:hypothetical protein
MSLFNARGIARLQAFLCRGFGGTMLCLLVTWGTGCASTNQQQPQQAATGAATGDGPNARQSALESSGPSASITARGAAIENDLNGKFSRAGSIDP